MIPHLKDRFFQRYGHELTEDILREISNLILRAECEKDPVGGGRERAWVNWRGQQVGAIFARKDRWIFILTFIPPRTRTCWSLPKRKKR